MCIWFVITIFIGILIRITIKWWYEKSDSDVGTSLVKRRFVHNQNATWRVHLVNSTGYILKIFFNYELYHVPSMEWIKKQAIEANRRELNGVVLKDFGDESEMNLFEQIYFDHIAIHRADPSASAINLRLRRTCFLQAMKERLRIVHQLKIHPEIREININSPICIMGLVRTGTTLLYNLLALDPEACYPTFHSCINPSLPWNFDSNEPDPRVATTEYLLRRLKSLMPNLDKAHYMNAHSPEECIHFFTNTGLDYMGIFSGKDLAYMTYVLNDIDSQQIYEYHRLLLQFLCYKKREFSIEKNHCLLKCPFHIFHLPSFLKVYKNARVIITHRDLNEVVPSFASLMEISSNSSFIDRFDIGRKALQVCGTLTDILLKEATMNDYKKNFVHVSYSELMKNPHQVIKNIYAQFQLKYTEEFDQKITEYLQQNPQGKHGRHKYSLVEYGLSKVELEYRFDTYSKTFLNKKI